MEILKRNIFIFILLALSIFAVFPLFQSGFFNIHDDAQIQRVFEMRTALVDGMFPVRWVPDLGYGYGYPIFNFYGPLPYYIGAIFTFLGLNSLIATKIMLFIPVVGSGFSMYFLAKEFWGKIGGLVSGIFYLYAPYHALDLYVRGDVGEVYGYLFIPIIFYSLWKYYKAQEYIFIVLGSLAFAGVIASHNLSALMITPFVILGAVLLSIDKKTLLILLIPIIGILVASFYWFPTLLEMNYTNVLSTIGGKAYFGDHFVCVRQFWDSPWMFGGSIPGCIDGLSFRLGKLHILFVGLSVFCSIFLIKKEKLKGLILTSSVISFFGVMFLMIKESKLLWEIPYMDFFQYPWRFLLLASFFSSFVAGSVIFVISKFETKKNIAPLLLVYSIILISPIVLYGKLFVPQNYLSKTSEDYTNSHNLTWTTSKISDEYLPKSFKTPEAPSEIIKDKITGKNIEVTGLSSKTNRLSAQINSTGNNEIILHTPFFPAWNYYVNGKKIEVNEDRDGVSLMIPDGENKLLAKFEQTHVEILGNVLSLSGILLLVAGIIYAKRKRHE